MPSTGVKSELWPLDISLQHHQAPQQSADNQMVPSRSVRRPALFLLFLYSVDQDDHVPPTQKPSLAQQTANQAFRSRHWVNGQIYPSWTSLKACCSVGLTDMCVTKASSFTLTSALCEPASHDSVVMTSQHPALSPDEMNTKQRKPPSLWRRGDAS